MPTLGCALHTSKHNYFSWSAFWAGIRVWQMLLVTFQVAQAALRHNETEIEISSKCGAEGGGGTGRNRQPLRGWGTRDRVRDFEVELAAR